MANGTLSTANEVQTGIFNVMLSLDAAVMGVEKSDFTLRTLAENGIAGVDFTVTGTDADFNLMFSLPSDKEGAFELSITGMVTPQGGSTPEAVMANTLIIVYDTTANVSMTFGAVNADSYEENGVIVVDVTFAEAVAFLSKAVFQVKKVGDDVPSLDGIEYVILGNAQNKTEFKLVFTVPPNHPSKRFQIEADGDVLKASSGVWDNVVATPITVNYDTRVPELKDYDIQAFYTPGENLFDLVLEYDTRCTVTDAEEHFGHEDATYRDFFIFAGADIGDPPNLYRYTGTGNPTLPPPAFPNENGNGDWDQQFTSEETTFYLLRWENIEEDPQGNFNITIKPGFVRGPVMPPMN